MADTADDVARQLVDDAIQPLGKAVEENAQPIADRAKEDYIQAAADTIKDQVSSHTPLTHARRAPCRAWLAHSWWQPIAATAPDGNDNSVAASQPEGVRGTKAIRDCNCRAQLSAWQFYTSRLNAHILSTNMLMGRALQWLHAAAVTAPPHHSRRAGLC